MFGVGIALLLAAHLGAAPWDVFHTGVSDLTGIPVGTVIIITGLLLLLLWIPLRETPGLGTLLNAFEIGLVVDLVLPVIPEPDQLAVRIAMMLAGVGIIAVGSGLYIGAGLGPGPRDGLMTGLARRGVSIRVARTGIEITILPWAWHSAGRSASVPQSSPSASGPWSTTYSPDSPCTSGPNRPSTSCDDRCPTPIVSMVRATRRGGSCDAGRSHRPG